MNLFRRRLLLATAVCGVLPHAACQRRVAEVSKGKVIEKIPMKTYAVGRFLIELPEFAKEVSISQNILGTEIEWKRATEKQYRVLLSTRAAALRGVTPATNLLISDSEGATPKSRIILFEGNEDRDALLKFEAYRYIDAFEGYFFSTGPVERAKIPEVNTSVNEVFALIQPRIVRPDNLDRGICIDHGFVAGSDPKLGEAVSIMATGDNITIVLSCHVIDRLDEGPSLLSRAERINGFPKVTMLRKKRREVAGLNGAEVSLIDTPQAGSKYSLQWAYDGKINSLRAPQIEVGIHSTGAITLQQDELLAVWDAVLTSIRLRPGSI